jgi:hypothetical protein
MKLDSIKERTLSKMSTLFLKPEEKKVLNLKIEADVEYIDTLE